MPGNDSTYALTKRAYYADFITAPLAALIAAIWLFKGYSVRPEVFVSSLVAGIFSWTFAEYAIHRWIFHSITGPKNSMDPQHRIHHVHPEDFIGASPITTAIIFVLLFFLATQSFPVIGAAWFIGFTLGYVVYIALHDCFHHCPVQGIYQRLADNHNWHHKRFTVNFGVSSPLWDWVFGTYLKPLKRK